MLGSSSVGAGEDTARSKGLGRDQPAEGRVAGDRLSGNGSQKELRQTTCPRTCCCCCCCRVSTALCRSGRVRGRRQRNEAPPCSRSFSPRADESAGETHAATTGLAPRRSVGKTDSGRLRRESFAPAAGTTACPWLLIQGECDARLSNSQLDGLDQGRACTTAVGPTDPTPTTAEPALIADLHPTESCTRAPSFTGPLSRRTASEHAHVIKGRIRRLQPEALAVLAEGDEVLIGLISPGAQLGVFALVDSARLCQVGTGSACRLDVGDRLRRSN
jgi:hypothetical protein